MKGACHLLVLILGLLPRLLFGQDRAEEAFNNYNLAKENYHSGHYNRALTCLQKAESISGDSESTLSLKINILYKLDSISGSYRSELRTSIDKFFRTVDKNEFPAEQYDEIVNISNNLNNELRAEKEDYESARRAATPESYNLFLSKYPNSKYSAEIQSLSRALPVNQEAEKLKKIYAAWSHDTIPMINKYQANFPWMVSTGLVFIAGGSVLAGFGTYSYLHPAQTVTNKWVVDANTNVLQTSTTYANRNAIYMYSMLGSGGALLITGIVLVACGGSYHTKLIKLKAEADRYDIKLKKEGHKYVELSWAPSYVPGSKTPDINLAFKF